MLNHVVLVGRLVRTPELFLTDSGKKKSVVTLAVNRSYKNQNGEYDTDFLDCTLWTGIAENTAEYCKTGDIVGIKGRLQTRLIENKMVQNIRKWKLLLIVLLFYHHIKVVIMKILMVITKIITMEKFLSM